MKIALVAHDRKKDTIVELAREAPQIANEVQALMFVFDDLLDWLAATLVEKGLARYETWQPEYNLFDRAGFEALPGIDHEVLA